MLLLRLRGWPFTLLCCQTAGCLPVHSCSGLLECWSMFIFPDMPPLMSPVPNTGLLLVQSSVQLVPFTQHVAVYPASTQSCKG